ncbi:DUF4136 domain-containing protein [Novosphingobium sp.]|uniref:DUF4136 domain-containing protein n=1 Tax=Novosphingobium sp. TaxID=1874826 RepID=UPI00352A1D31
MNKNTKRNRGLALVAVPLLLASLGGCASTFDAKVSRFQSQLPAPAGQTFAIVAENPRNQGGLEFSQYASLVAAQLQKVGYVPAASPDNADLIVHFDYGVDQGRDRVRTTGVGPDPFWGPWYGGYGPGFWGRGGFYGGGGFYGRRGWGYGWYDPFFWGGGYNSVDVVTVYTSGIDLKIDSRVDGKRLFEGKAEAASQSNRLPYLVPNLVEAMFTDFPGHNGETLRISVAPEKKTVKQVK